MLLSYSVADAQLFKTLPSIPSNETNSTASFQVILGTGATCASINETFQTTACSDPSRIEVVLDSVTEVDWSMDKKGKGGRKVIKCRKDDLVHTISGIKNGVSISNASFKEFQVDGTEDMITVPFIELTWDLSAEGQAQGAEMKLTLFFFNENVTIIFEGQKADVFNGTVKSTYEVKFAVVFK